LVRDALWGRRRRRGAMDASGRGRRRRLPEPTIALGYLCRIRNGIRIDSTEINSMCSTWCTVRAPSGSHFNCQDPNRLAVHPESRVIVNEFTDCDWLRNSFIPVVVSSSEVRIYVNCQLKVPGSYDGPVVVFLQHFVDRFLLHHDSYRRNIASCTQSSTARVVEHRMWRKIYANSPCANNMNRKLLSCSRSIKQHLHRDTVHGGIVRPWKDCLLPLPVIPLGHVVFVGFRGGCGCFGGTSSCRGIVVRFRNNRRWRFSLVAGFFLGFRCCWRFSFVLFGFVFVSDFFRFFCFFRRGIVCLGE
jgi:hypothetical protein